MARTASRADKSSGAKRRKASTGGRNRPQAGAESWTDRFMGWWKTANMSQSDFAKRLGVSPMTVSRWTRGIARPTRDAAARIDRLIRARIRQARASGSVQEVTDRIAAVLEGLPLGRRLGLLMESFGRTLEQAISSGAKEPGATGGRRRTGAGSDRADSRPAAGRRGSKSKAARTSSRGSASASRGKQTKAARGSGAGASSRSASSSRGGSRKRRAGSHGSGAGWAGVIHSIQRAEGWKEGPNRRLAEALQVAPSTISNWLGGARTPRGAQRNKLVELAQKHGIQVPA